MSSFRAKEFDLAKGEYTGQTMYFDADSVSEAARKLAYTLNIGYGPSFPSRWGVTKSGRIVARPVGDISWSVEAETTSGGTRGARRKESALKSTIDSPKIEKQVRGAFKKKFRRVPTDVFYEHGQWFARLWSPGYGDRDDEKTWSVVDAVPGVLHGLDFEGVG